MDRQTLEFYGRAAAAGHLTAAGTKVTSTKAEETRMKPETIPSIRTNARKVDQGTGAREVRLQEKQGKTEAIGGFPPGLIGVRHWCIWRSYMCVNPLVVPPDGASRLFHGG